MELASCRGSKRPSARVTIAKTTETALNAPTVELGASLPRSISLLGFLPVWWVLID